MTQNNTKVYHKLSDFEEYLAAQIVDATINIHKHLGPGLLESIYEKCLCHELKKRKINFSKQLQVPVIYDGLNIDDGLRIDILVEKLVVIELKAQENYHPVWDAQLLSYLKLTQLRLGLMLNFHVPLMKNGIKRMIL